MTAERFTNSSVAEGGMTFPPDLETQSFGASTNDHHTTEGTTVRMLLRYAQESSSKKPQKPQRFSQAPSRGQPILATLRCKAAASTRAAGHPPSRVG